MSDRDGSIAGNPRIVARRNDGRGGSPDDDRRPGERAAGRQVLAVIDVGSDAPGGADVEDLAAACGFRLRATLDGGHRRRRWRRGPYGKRPAEHFDVDAVGDAAILLPGGSLEFAPQERSVRIGERARRQADRDLVALADVAGEGGALLGQRLI